MEGEPLRQRFASPDAPILDSMREIEVDVQAVSGRSNAAEDPARSVEDDHLRGDLDADVVELLDRG
jgi:hypothetical protein